MAFSIDASVANVKAMTDNQCLTFDYIGISSEFDLQFQCAREGANLDKA